MEINIKYTDKDVKIHGIKCAIFGDSGTGKTRLLATAPKPIIISAEHGLLSLKGDHVPYVEVSSVEEVQDVYSWLLESEEAKQFETVGATLDDLKVIREGVFLKVHSDMYADALVPQEQVAHSEYHRFLYGLTGISSSKRY